MVVAINKWDLLDSGQKEWAEAQVIRKLAFLDFAKVHYISALKGNGIGGLFGSIDKAHKSAWTEMSTSRLNDILEKAVQATAPPVRRGRRIRIKYAHQGGKNPLRVIVHGNQVQALAPAYKRYLANTIRRAFHLEGAPVWVECRQEANPFAGKRPQKKDKRGRRRKKST
jgi:GTP-binding protein